MNPVTVTSGSRYSVLENESDKLADEQPAAPDAIANVNKQLEPAFPPGLDIPARASMAPSSPSSTRAEPSGSPDRVGQPRKRVPGTPSEPNNYDVRKALKKSANTSNFNQRSVTLAEAGTSKKTVSSQQLGKGSSSTARPAKKQTQDVQSTPAASGRADKGKGRDPGNRPPPASVPKQPAPKTNQSLPTPAPDGDATFGPAASTTASTPAAPSAAENAQQAARESAPTVAHEQPAVHAAPPSLATAPAPSLDADELGSMDMDIDADSVTAFIKTEPDEEFFARILANDGPIVIDDDSDGLPDSPSRGPLPLPGVAQEPHDIDMTERPPTPRIQPVVHADMVIPELHLAAAATLPAQQTNAPPSQGPQQSPPPPPPPHLAAPPNLPAQPLILVPPAAPAPQQQPIPVPPPAAAPQQQPQQQQQPARRAARFAELGKDAPRRNTIEAFHAAEFDPIFTGTEIAVNGIGGRALIDGLVENEHVQGMSETQRLYFDRYEGKKAIVRIIQMEDVKFIRADHMPRAIKRLMRDIDLAILEQLPDEKVLIVGAYSDPDTPPELLAPGTAIMYNLSDFLYNVLHQNTYWLLGGTQFTFSEFETGRSWFLYTAEGMELELHDLPEVGLAVAETWQRDEYIISLFGHYTTHNLGAERAPLQRFIGSLSLDALDVKMNGTPIRQVNIKGDTFDLPLNFFRTLVAYLRTTVIWHPAFGALRAFARPWECKRCGAKSHPHGKCPSHDLTIPLPDLDIPAEACLPPPPMPPAPPAPPAPPIVRDNKKHERRGNDAKYKGSKNSTDMRQTSTSTTAARTSSTNTAAARAISNNDVASGSRTARR
ncbi:hypothetical protein AURDEDRAFT_170960 [Auricularia subglabra TFB-10046 SS5]|nr:hypothetical protein AURDEDRAFT_170960 [Auricularia subglabra TFB-10046 SS5]